MDRYSVIVGTRATRTKNYVEMVSSHFEMMTPLYQSGWADSFHLPPFAGSESLVEALRAQEKSIADEGKFSRGDKVLDVGCGIGRPALTIAGHSQAEITGVNITPAQVVIAQNLVAESGLSELVRVVLADAMNLLFRDEWFDAAYSFDALCHTPDKAAAYTEIARVLKPGGAFVGYDWFYQDTLTDQEYDDYIEPVCRTFALPYLISLPQLENHLKRSGFEVDIVESASKLGDVERNWDIFEKAADSLSERKTAAEQMMREAILAVVRAGRAGSFMIGHWRARKTADIQECS